MGDAPIDFGDGFKPSRERLAGEREKRLDLAGRVMPFGVAYLDEFCLGIHPTDLVLLCASSGAGKTTIAALIAQLAAARGKRVHFFALEAHKAEIEQRMLFRELCDVMRERGAPRLLTFQQWMYNTVEVPLFLENEARARFDTRVAGMFTFYRGQSFTANDITKRFEEVRAQTDLIVLDHLHYVDTDDVNENRGLKEITKAIRDSALAMERPVIVVAHLRKRDRNKPRLIPDLEDVHGSSDIIKIATKVIALAPARDKASGDPGVSNTYIQVVKDRFVGVNGHAALCQYDLRTLRYRDQYIVGRLSFGGDAFENISAAERPAWCRSGLCLGTPATQEERYA